MVEAEKTAVIMSEVKPEYLWLATGGKTELNVAKLKPLASRRVILFPDTDETVRPTASGTTWPRPPPMSSVIP